MILEKNDNIFDADVEALVNPVNCVGVMGKGLALEFKRRYPENFNFYRNLAVNNKIFPGQVYTYRQSYYSHPLFIVNFPTKRHWKNESEIEDIDAGLESLCREVLERQIRSIAIPALGCGLGNLSWKDVKVSIENAFSPEYFSDLAVLVYPPK